MTSFALRRKNRILPGFGLTLGYTVIYTSLLVLIPLSMLFIKTHTMSWADFRTTVTDAEVVAAYKLTFGASLAAAVFNVFLGLLVAWVLARYSFPFKRLIDGLVDLPFALPTAVAGISLTALYSQNGWIGRYLEPHHIKIAFTPLGVMLALVFIGLPFVVRTVQPVLEDLDSEVEEAAASLGASRWQTVFKVVLPSVIPALLTGFALAFARALGEYGSISYISGNLPFKTEIVSQVIMGKLDGYDYAGATAIAVVMLLASFVLLLLINILQWWTRKRQGAI